MKTYDYDESPRTFRILMISHIVGAVIGLLEVLLAFVQTTHILGFFFGLILLGSCVGLLVFMFLSRKNGTFEKWKMIIILISIFVFALAVLTFLILFIKLLTFMYSPNMKKRYRSPVPEEETADRLIIRNDGEKMYVDAEFPTFDYSHKDQIGLDWNKFKKCCGKGAQVRIQHDEYKMDMTDAYIYFHTNESDAFLGLVVDMALYASAKQVTANIRCQRRIGHKYIADETKIQNECIKKVYSCYMNSLPSQEAEEETTQVVKVSA